MSFRILHGNSSELLRGFGDNTIDSVVTDPPAAIAFMGHEWDRFRSKTEFGMFLLEVFTECLRVLKPGGHVLVWAIPKTSHCFIRCGRRKTPTLSQRHPHILSRWHDDLPLERY